MARKIQQAIQRAGALERLLVEASPRSLERYAAEAAALAPMLLEIRETVAEAPETLERAASRADLEVLSWHLARAKVLLGGVAATLEQWASLSADDGAPESYDAAGIVFGPPPGGLVATHG